MGHVFVNNKHITFPQKNKNKHITNICKYRYKKTYDKYLL